MKNNQQIRVCGVVVREWHMLLLATSPFWLLIPALVFFH